MKGEDADLLLGSIDECFGLTKHDFVNGNVIYTKWGDEKNHINLEDLGHRSLKISKSLGDIYIDKIVTDGWVIVGKGTTLHCEHIDAGMGYVPDFEGFLM